MSYKPIAILVISLCISGCSVKNLPPLNESGQKIRKEKIIILFSRLIAESRHFGTSARFAGIRTYSNALVNVLPRSDTGISIVCARATFSSLGLISQPTVNLSATVIEGTDGITLKMRNETDTSPKCPGPYEPFPELEALSSKGPA